jgi:hypothetical protein
MMKGKFQIHLISGNGARRKRQDADGPKDRTQLLKYAIFYLVVAAILFVTTQTGRKSTARGNRSPSNLHIDLSAARKLEPNRLGSDPAEGGTYVVRFRLTNQGKQPIFYPSFPDTNRPLGQIVYRVAPQSDWKPLSQAESSPFTLTPLNGRAVAWIEMPPGGWADGEYEDPGSPAGDHAFELEVKVATDGKVSPLLSRAYPVNTN